MYTVARCDMIAVKREVAAKAKADAGFPWSECQMAKVMVNWRQVTVQKYRLQ